MARGDPKHPAFGAKLKWIREVRGISAMDLAERSGFSPRTIHNWEAGDNVTYPNCCRIAAVLGVHVSFLWDHFPPPDAKI